MHVSAEVRRRAWHEAVFAADACGRLLAQHVVGGIDVPAGYNTPGFVRPFHFYCAVCDAPLNYWDQLQDHLGDGDEARRHVRRRRELEARARSASRLVARSRDGGETLLVSVADRTFSCTACGVVDQPWHRVEEHRGSEQHRARQARGAARPAEGPGRPRPVRGAPALHPDLAAAAPAVVVVVVE
ncbi:unnamed protein product [Prorocentrum cordatum]|uniref:C2H2-type domain-containing protein n=1 Tax=Prorocentrum cordatum TaxID=2364126 RepID=A0ABN9VE58_9DINO|nr:unnamed protein product [Polarella glacialis]